MRRNLQALGLAAALLAALLALPSRKLLVAQL